MPSDVRPDDTLDAPCPRCTDTGTDDTLMPRAHDAFDAGTDDTPMPTIAFGTGTMPRRRSASGAQRPSFGNVESKEKEDLSLASADDAVHAAERRKQITLPSVANDPLIVVWEPAGARRAMASRPRITIRPGDNRSSCCGVNLGTGPESTDCRGAAAKQPRQDWRRSLG